VAVVALEKLLDGYSGIAHPKWRAWRRKEGLDDLPTEFADVLEHVMSFADPVLTGEARGSTWQPTARVWLNQLASKAHRVAEPGP
jgi:hypothetical protein